MSNTKIILHGGFSRVDNELNRSFFSELVRDVPTGGVVLLCYFAYEGDYSKHIEAHSAYIRAARSDVQVVVASKESFVQEVGNADALYINGGHTPWLVSALSEYPFAEMIRGKTVAGSSAGAYVLGKKCTAHTSECSREGLGIVPYNIVCHFESEKLPPTESSLRDVRADTSAETVYLRDYEWRVVH